MSTQSPFSEALKATVFVMLFLLKIFSENARVTVIISTSSEGEEARIFCHEAQECSSTLNMLQTGKFILDPRVQGAGRAGDGKWKRDTWTRIDTPAYKPET